MAGIEASVLLQIMHLYLLLLFGLQAKALQQHIKASGIQIDVVIVSPLKRALQTAVGCFGNHSSKPSNGTPPLMLEYIEQQGKITAHPAVSAEGCPPFVCYELCREHLGVHPCDRRSSVSELAAEYPGGLSWLTLSSAAACRAVALVYVWL
jgi:hypothetical protein